MKDIINKCAEYSVASLTEITQKQMPWKTNYIRNEHRINYAIMLPILLYIVPVPIFDNNVKSIIIF